MRNILSIVKPTTGSGILGQGFTGSPLVKFGGVAATSVALDGAGYRTAGRSHERPSWGNHADYGLDYSHQPAVIPGKVRVYSFGLAANLDLLLVLVFVVLIFYFSRGSRL